ncbi:MAG TPA: hypothetical protein VNH22_00175 [Blastocatellia bacterium]|nr:hypothetical protein [Blastocatellia bacterium]
MSASLEGVKGRLHTLEKTVSERLYDTRPIWERALAEIVALRSEQGQMHSEAAEMRSELGHGRSEAAEMRSDLSQVSSGALGMRSELSQMRSELSQIRSELLQMSLEVRDSLHKFGGKIDLLVDDVFAVRAENKILERRIDNLEPEAS